jgi:glycosyltransferase involved in cell wall biosynthesis
VLPELRLSGGALVVAELVNELRLLGADARIATLKARADVYRTRLLHRPLVFDSIDAMTRDLPRADVVVATHWSTAEWVRDLVAARRARSATYLLQDYEAWFYPEDDLVTRARVEASYAMIADKVVTSAWLAELLGQAGHDSTTIPPGLGLDVFYPRPVSPPPRPVVLAMARPRTPRRGFDTVVAALTKVHEAVPDAQIVLFGERLGEMRLPFPYRGEGVITDQDRLARLYTSARVHFDGSDFQAFGRAALEAMACGTVSVLTNVGGVHEYARDGDNAVLVAPSDPSSAATAIIELLRDGDRFERLRDNGLATVPAFSMRRRARVYLAHFERVAGARARR